MGCLVAVLVACNAWYRGTSGYLWALAGEEPALCGVATETRPPGFPVRVKR